MGTEKSKVERNHIVVDTFGLPMAVAVHEANIHDSKGAPKVIEKLAYKFPRLVKILADGGYQGFLGEWMTKKFGWSMEVVLRPDECTAKFAVLPNRWIVEQLSLGWKTIDISPSTMNILPKLQKPWYYWHFA